MNAYEKAQTLGLTGTDAEIVAQLKSITAGPINLAYLMETLNFRGMLRKTDGSGGQERWVGTLQNLKSALVAIGLTEFVNSYELWFSHVTNPRQLSWDTSQPQWATAFAAMEANFAGGANMPSVADFEAVSDLGGGRPYFTLTVDEFAAQRTTYTQQVAAQTAANTLNSQWVSVQNEIINPAVHDKTTLIAALRQAADTLEAG